MTIDSKLKKINSLHLEIRNLSSPQAWDSDFLEKIKIDFTYNSNKIEGNKISHGQTIQLLREFITPKNASSRDILDIVNHKKVLDLIFENYNTKEITESNIKKLHKELMKGWEQWSDSTYYDPGKYKMFENLTTRSTGKIHYYTQPDQVYEEMRQLMQKTNELLFSVDFEQVDRHPLCIATFFHQQFLNKIHPFGDGNGRIGRIFMNLILLKSGFPPIFIQEVDKMEYLICFEMDEKHPGTMLNFMADRLHESLEIKLAYLQSRSN